MKERSRPSGLEGIAGDGVRLGGRLALGLLAIPLLGLALLTKGTQRNPATRESGAASTAPEEQVAEPNRAGRPDQAADPDGGTEPGGPERAEIEQALRNLADATMPKRSRVNGGVTASAPRADAPERPVPAKAEKRSRSRAKTAAVPPSLSPS